jgi:SAM-dependent methyltransferase
LPREDLDKWQAIYTRGGGPPADPSPAFLALERWLPRQGRALDIASGAGRHAVWLARRGLDVTAVDIAPAGLDRAHRSAAEQGVTIQTEARDLLCDPLPQGPWDLIVQHHFLYRPLFETFHRHLAPGGRLVIVHPTRKNLERHARPSARWLLDDGELHHVPGLRTLHHHEDWNAAGRHEVSWVGERSR